jgi:hypothetical protein
VGGVRRAALRLYALPRRSAAAAPKHKARLPLQPRPRPAEVSPSVSACTPAARPARLGSPSWPPGWATVGTLGFLGWALTEGRSQDYPEGQNWTVVGFGAMGKTPPYPSAGVVVGHIERWTYGAGLSLQGAAVA